MSSSAAKKAWATRRAGAGHAGGGVEKPNAYVAKGGTRAQRMAKRMASVKASAKTSAKRELPAPGPYSPKSSFYTHFTKQSSSSKVAQTVLGGYQLNARGGVIRRYVK